MKTKIHFCLYFPAAIALIATSGAAQDLPVLSATVDDRTVLMMPWDGLDFPGESSFAGIDFDVSMEQGLLAYRATWLGRTYTAWADASAPATGLRSTRTSAGSGRFLPPSRWNWSTTTRSACWCLSKGRLRARPTPNWASR
ncbi:MAG: hypothetical protein OXQ89_16160 [Rhodospirillaceae bacterium]|nr:hypothetical protein [Rhodospirillaceae bacterium]MDE0359552.1 hypothetical protein [Rhodospirillaceae bacterium]